MIPITASMLYSYVQCPHRVTLDLFGDPAKRDPVSPFVELLWERGNLYEKEIVAGLKVPFVNLREVQPAEERERRTLEAMKSGAGLIYGGRISAGDLLGEPDLLRRRGEGYLPGDIKSGSGLEGTGQDQPGRPKKHYAVQLALYVELLEALELSAAAEPFVLDVRGDEVVYDLDAARGTRLPPMREEYREIRERVREICRRASLTRPGLCAACKLCHWRSHCFARMKASDDLTLIPELGREKREKMLPHLPTIKALAEAGAEKLADGKRSLVPGIGVETLRKFHDRARLIKTPGAKPYFTGEASLPREGMELFYDVETDPMREVCYLHGFVERTPRGERYLSFFAARPTEKDEREAFVSAWNYISASDFSALYVYSHYEETTLKRLAARHPGVATAEEVEKLFGRNEVVDLYGGLVRPKMVWPTHDLSIKTLAAFLGFKWRDPEPSGAVSIQWYHEWVVTGDSALKERIIKYNEDDCRAMRVLLDWARKELARGPH